jgi:radical SAM superfamily enzyme YgiQ (UPF0313 family)
MSKRPPSSKKSAFREPKAIAVLPQPFVGETFLYTPVAPEVDAVRVGWCYPAEYTISASSLGYLTLFKQLDMRRDVEVARITTDTLDRHKGKPYELLGFSLAFELDIVEFLRSLETLGVPLYQSQRDDVTPLVFAGGPVAMTNPEPFAPFVDFYLLGEGEEMLEELIDTLKAIRGNGLGREATLRHLATTVAGCYVPSLYEVTYQSDEGPIAAIAPRFEGVPAVVEKRRLSAETMANTVATSPILTSNTIFSSTYLIEIMRGCSHRCRFCMASYAMLPVRGTNADVLLSEMDRGLEHTDKLGLLGALIADHPEFDAICEGLHQRMDHNPNLRMNSAALRVDGITERMVTTFMRGGQKQLTVAIESGSEKLRRRINKNLKQETIFKAMDVMASAGLPGLKFYGMVGLPDETDADIESTIELLKDIKKQTPKLKLVLGCSSFVPKGGTPFQWMPREANAIIEARFKRLTKGLLKVADFRPSSTQWDSFQAIISRGDRRMGPLLERFYRLGGSLGSLKRADKELRSEGLRYPSLDWYGFRARTEDEVLPWEALSLGVPKAILWKESLPPKAHVGGGSSPLPVAP